MTKLINIEKNAKELHLFAVVVHRIERSTNVAPVNYPVNYLTVNGNADLKEANDERWSLLLGGITATVLQSLNLRLHHTLGYWDLQRRRSLSHYRVVRNGAGNLSFPLFICSLFFATLTDDRVWRMKRRRFLFRPPVRNEPASGAFHQRSLYFASVQWSRHWEIVCAK